MQPPKNRIARSLAPIRKALPLPALALATVVAKDGKSIYASSDTLFKGAVFGRDSLEVIDDLMRHKPALVHNVLLTLGRLQGLTDNLLNEEQPGKIIHEYRQTYLDGKPIDDTSRQIFYELAKKWGGTDDELAYYGSIDATPHFLRTLQTYCRLHGSSILQETVIQRNGQTVTMQSVTEAAVAWLEKQLSISRSGMLEYKKVNPYGISNQVWKDSEEFYVHENGENANHERPIASIEVQGLAYDALMAATVLIPHKTADYRQQAYALRDTTIKHLWQSKRRYFALGTDYTPEGALRVINTATANPAALLDTGFFDALAPEQRHTYIHAITSHIMGKDFLTNAGIRSRSLEYANLIPFWDYHGSFVSWPKETYDIAKGLRRQGFPRLARQLENRLLNIVLKTREYPEFVYVDGFGRVLTGSPANRPYASVVVIEGKNTPERLQAWTVSALMAIVADRGQVLKLAKPNAKPSWQTELETQIMRQIPHVNFHVNPLKLWLQYPTHKYHIAK